MFAPQSASLFAATKAARPLDEGRMFFENSANRRLSDNLPHFRFPASLLLCFFASQRPAPLGRASWASRIAHFLIDICRLEIDATH
jgi:hypothetical protein